MATPKDIDTVLKLNMGAKTGICEMMDKVGLDTVYNIENHYVKERGLDGRVLEWLKESYIDKGNLGNKTGKGLLHN